MKNLSTSVEDLPRREWDLTLRTVVSSRASATSSSTDALGVVELNPSETLVATGGIARKIRLYRLETLAAGDDVAALEHASTYDLCICTPAKLSSLRWRPNSGDRVLCSGDYDGVVTEYDLERQTPVSERDEHGGRRVWSVDYARWDPASLAASGSDDGTFQMWDPRADSSECLATVRPSSSQASPVCCVEFSPFGGPIVAVGCADQKAYVYDVRSLSEPVSVLAGHNKTVSYVRFLDARTVVSAGTDGCLKMWDLGGGEAVRTYRGHVNSRSFVGLSVWRSGGLLGCGSENNQLFVYDKRWAEPIWVHGFGGPEIGSGFVSTVCWSQVGDEQCTLLAGGSDGVLKLFVGHSKMTSPSSAS